MMFELHLSIIDIIDILILAFILYQIFMMIRGTQTLQILVGISIILVLVVFAHIFNLSSIIWIARGVGRVGMIALLIIFAPEIRQIFARMGGSRVFGLLVGPKREVINETVNAVERFRKFGIGSLIVFEKNIGLGELIDRGVKIDSKVKAELLEAIFKPGGPLHDGAVIIRNDRIAACSVMLPLSTNPHLAPYLGARHRAALGITEVSDAVSVIVSEETRVASVAKSGELITCKDMIELKKQIFRGLYGR
ncbi:MAG: TIGR00159 family protein [Candidatus Coatesbacteria bacterium]|nr:MAG: TIGR00159 family protein [Candidatus Coatesbacteria bacterium]RLC44961.1 MAG: TIGR00159 family protein [Candidatus Coatesbacteria bacterium]